MYLFVLPAIGWRHELRSERPSIIIVIIIIVMPALSSTEPRSLCIDPYVNTLYCLKIYVSLFFLFFCSLMSYEIGRA